MYFKTKDKVKTKFGNGHIVEHAQVFDNYKLPLNLYKVSISSKESMAYGKELWFGEHELNLDKGEKL